MKRSCTKPIESQSSSQTSKHLYLSQFSIFLHQYIDETVDVGQDGNCGFHDIATLHGWGEESWSLVWTHLDVEVYQHHQMYSNVLYGTVSEVRSSLRVDSLEEKSDATSLPEHVLWKAARVGKDEAVVEAVQNVYDECTPTRPTHKAGKGISRRIESVASQKEVPGRKLKKAGNDIPTTSGTKSQIMMRLEKMVEESDIMHGAIRSVDFDEGVFGIAHSEIIAKEDMQQLFEHEELGIAVIHTYIWYMYVTLMRGTELCNRFIFIAASRINTTFITKNPTSVKNELVDRFMVADDNTTPSLYFLPFNSGNGGHWVLVAMDLSRLMVYYLDSLSGDWSKYPSMKKTVDA
ncbi:hypothetical protein KIW84_014432 [Lathyrus oleraceus]|uniref:Ubiquitin-like protease family profile domain-containing protein n=1 Tax=Pisum sativum TaxID=3888 RepID=A0A9D5BNC6_PEA|nr:hypothetical protein KIW84_014432 [Pisum sativum]